MKRGGCPLIRLSFRCNRSEQAVRLAVGASGEIENIRVRVATAAEGDCPQAVNDQGLVGHGVPQETVRFPVITKCGNAAIAEITDEDVAAEPAKRKRCP